MADLAELLAWGILLLSGFNGLSRLEGIPPLFYWFVTKRKATDRRDLKKVEGKITEVDSRLKTEYERHRSAFKFGVVLLVISRGWCPRWTCWDESGT